MDRYFEWLTDVLGLILVLAVFLPHWPWPFDVWPWGAVGGLVTFLWLGTLAMEFLQQRTGYYWPVKLGALLALAVIASLLNT